jgi:hypothetical protein
VIVVNAEGGIRSETVEGAEDWPLITSVDDRIVFSEDDRGQYWVNIADSQTDTNYVTPGLDPSFSPDGTRIAFVSNRPELSLYVMNSDGSDQRAIYPEVQVESLNCPTIAENEPGMIRLTLFNTGPTIFAPQFAPLDAAAEVEIRPNANMNGLEIPAGESAPSSWEVSSSEAGSYPITIAAESQTFGPKPLRCRVVVISRASLLGLTVAQASLVAPVGIFLGLASLIGSLVLAILQRRRRRPTGS